MVFSTNSDTIIFLSVNVYMFRVARMRLFFSLRYFQVQNRIFKVKSFNITRRLFARGRIFYFARYYGQTTFWTGVNLFLSGVACDSFHGKLGDNRFPLFRDRVALKMRLLINFAENVERVDWGFRQLTNNWRVKLWRATLHGKRLLATKLFKILPFEKRYPWNSL